MFSQIHITLHFYKILVLLKQLTILDRLLLTVDRKYFTYYNLLIRTIILILILIILILICWNLLGGERFDLPFKFTLQPVSVKDWIMKDEYAEKKSLGGTHTHICISLSLVACHLFLLKILSPNYFAITNEVEHSSFTDTHSKKKNKEKGTLLFFFSSPILAFIFLRKSFVFFN